MPSHASFEKYSIKEVVVNDQSLANYITLTPKAYPNMFGRRKNKVYTATHVNIVERLINKLMRGGTGEKIGGKVIRTEGALQGKKLKVMHIVEDAFEIIQQEDRKESCPGSCRRAAECGSYRGHDKGKIRRNKLQRCSRNKLAEEA